MTARPALVAATVAAFLLGTSALARQSVWGNFTSTAPNPGNSITAAADFRAPTASASVVGKTAGGITGQIKKGGTYYATPTPATPATRQAASPPSPPMSTRSPPARLWSCSAPAASARTASATATAAPR